jgi:MFS family permease
VSAPPRDDTVRAIGNDGPHGRVLAAPYRRLTVGIVATVVFIAFEGMAVATVMPVAVADLGGIATYASGFTAFLITSLVGMVAGGDVCDARGPRLPFLVSGAVFGAGLLLAGLAPTMRCSWRGAPCRAWAWASPSSASTSSWAARTPRSCGPGLSAPSRAPGCFRR